MVARVHEGGRVITAAPPAFVKEADPVGEYPLTVAVHVVDVPTCTGEGTHPTATIDAAGVTVTDDEGRLILVVGA
jgi:hypothetical protein